MKVQYKTEQQAFKEAFQNGYEIAMSDVQNTLDYINYRLAEIRDFDKKNG